MEINESINNVSDKLIPKAIADANEDINIGTFGIYFSYEVANVPTRQGVVIINFPYNIHGDYSVQICICVQNKPMMWYRNYQKEYSDWYYVNNELAQ